MRIERAVIVGSYPLKKVLDRRQDRAGEYADHQRDPDGDHRPCGAGFHRRDVTWLAQVRTRRVGAHTIPTQRSRGSNGL